MKFSRPKVIIAVAGLIAVVALVLVAMVNQNNARAAKITAAFEGLTLKCVDTVTFNYYSSNISGYQTIDSETFTFGENGTVQKETYHSVAYNDKYKSTNKSAKDEQRTSTYDYTYQVNVASNGQVSVTIGGDTYSVSLSSDDVPIQITYRYQGTSGTLVKIYNKGGGRKYTE